MATMRVRNGKFQYIVKRKKLLPKPVHLTFDSQSEGDAYVAELESLLDRGIVPVELLPGNDEVKLHPLIDNYIRAVHITDSDRQLLEIHKRRISNISVGKITYKWSEDWIKSLKHKEKLAPSTITKHVGALARCLDWGLRHDYVTVNPLRSLPKGYAVYTPGDVRSAGVERTNQERDRRLEEGEEARILEVIAGQRKSDDKQRLLDLEQPAEYRTFFLLALETAMRMREMYTLEREQVDLSKKTIFLDKTKNGDKRQVPMSSPATLLLEAHLSSMPERKYVFQWFNGSYTRSNLNKTSAKLSRKWSRVFGHAGCVGLTFHDLRHEATSRIFERTTLSDLEIAKITGHKDLRMLQRYANLRGSGLAERLW